MPTLPLYDPLAPPFAPHRVTAPGGYEWWRFEASDPSAGIGANIDFYQGYPQDPTYRRRYRLYRLWPTRFAPPVPKDYTAAELVISENGRRIAKCLERGPLAVSDDALDLSVGQWHAAHRGRDFRVELPVGSLVFRHRGEVECSPRHAGNGHWQTLPSPSFDVDGALEVGGRRIVLSTGVLLHRFGTRPLWGTARVPPSLSGQV